MARVAFELLACLAGVCLLGDVPAQASRRGPPEGSAAWLRGQLLLERPATALAAAADAWKRGDRLRAEWLLAEIAARHPLIADHADLLRARVLLERGKVRAAERLLEASVVRYVDTPLRPVMASELGNARAALGDEEGARKAWRQALDASSDSELRAGLLFRTAESQERSGDPAEAHQTYTVLWYLYPQSDEAAVAAERLAELESGRTAGPRRTASDWRRRADQLFRNRDNEAALAAYEQALQRGLSPSEAAGARKQRAHTLFRMRRYTEAVRAFEKLPQDDEIRLWRARSLARAGQVHLAIAQFEALAHKRRGGLALRARFLAALLLDGRGESERARRHLESLTRGDRRSAVARASLWRLAWGAYRDGRYAEAIGRLDELIAGERDPIDGLRSLYWRARALEHLGRRPEPAARGGGAVAAPGRLAREAARRAFERIAREYPLSYYGWRARQRLPGGLIPAPADEEPAARAALPASGRRAVSGTRLARARILLEAGFREEALAELAQASREVGGLDDRLAVARLLNDAGGYRSAQLLVVDPYKVTLARGPSATLEELWWHAWPAAYRNLVERATAEPGSVEPALVFSIMREESGFRPKVVSPVGARGLLQIMEPTGERLAAAMGDTDFTADDLFEPGTNIRLGSYYLRELSQQFDGRLSAAIASYNAGPIVVSRWLEARPEAEDDEWVEAIPYDQTRSYVKRVLRSLQAYHMLY